MATKQIIVERFSITSAKPFAKVVSAIAAQVGHPDMTQFDTDIKAASDDQELQQIVNNAVGPSDLMEFLRLDQGAVIGSEFGSRGPNVIRLLIGNPLTMRKMAKHVHDAGSYAPVTILIDERPDGVHLSYDRMTSLIAPYGNLDAQQVAKDLDDKVEGILEAAAR